jgi:hypothetical protein
MFLVLAAVWLYVLREPNKAFTEAERHALQVAGVVSAVYCCFVFHFGIAAQEAATQRCGLTS